MRLLITLLLAASGALNAQTVDVVATGGAGCDVVVNDVIVSTHTQQHKAQAEATNQAFANAGAQVEFHCNNVFRVTVKGAPVVSLPPPVVVPPPVGTPDTADLSWQASAGATGYRLYYGFAPRTYLQAKGAGIDLGNGTVTTYTATAAAAGKRHYFSITAYGQSGESGYSNEVFKDMP